ncbi:Uncharacterised protein [Serratia marcescens]|uniref:hypothetical protein n=1 Tax=Serratia marcescens TaxID=615 RepID=UPI000744E31A|nr:hypothetical protein [Serratia marcescens]CVF79538.1 Uncharacterised protein [Serratia marcescens]
MKNIKQHIERVKDLSEHIRRAKAILENQGSRAPRFFVEEREYDRVVRVDNDLVLHCLREFVQRGETELRMLNNALETAEKVITGLVASEQPSA